jgi:excisionase family DNA binding protein
MTSARPYTVDTAAEYLGCSTAHVRNLCAKGALRHFRIGRLIRIPAAAMEELECASCGSEAATTLIGETEASRNARRSELRIVSLPIGG